MQGQLLVSWHSHDSMLGCTWLLLVTTNRKQFQTFLYNSMVNTQW